MLDIQVIDDPAVATAASYVVSPSALIKTPVTGEFARSVSTERSYTKHADNSFTPDDARDG
jgi:hypothetical protein